MNCQRCGMVVRAETIERRKARGIFDNLCSDCRNGKSYEINYGELICRPWRGEVDEDLNPIDHTTQPFLPGQRVCGHRDCVNKDHIIPSAPTPLELERNDISYRTGRLSELQDYMRELYG